MKHHGVRRLLLAIFVAYPSFAQDDQTSMQLAMRFEIVGTHFVPFTIAGEIPQQDLRVTEMVRCLTNMPREHHAFLPPIFIVPQLPGSRTYGGGFFPRESTPNEDLRAWIGKSERTGIPDSMIEELIDSEEVGLIALTHSRFSPSPREPDLIHHLTILHEAAHAVQEAAGDLVPAGTSVADLAQVYENGNLREHSAEAYSRYIGSPSFICRSDVVPDRTARDECTARVRGLLRGSPAFESVSENWRPKGDCRNNNELHYSFYLSASPPTEDGSEHGGTDEERHDQDSEVGDLEPLDPEEVGDDSAADPSDLTARVEALVEQARERCRVPEGGFRIGRQRADFSRGSTPLVVQIMRRAGRDPAASGRKIHLSLQAFEDDLAVSGRDTPIDLTFAVAKSARESGAETVFSTSASEVVSGGRDAHRRGAAGFDYLWDIRQWVPQYKKRLRPVTKDDADLLDPKRRPAWIARQDLFIAGIAYARYAERQFRAHVARAYSDMDDTTREALLSGLSTDAKRAWVQATFARPGWMQPALRYLRRQARVRNGALDLNAILSDEGLVEGRHVPQKAATAGFSMGRARVTACEAWMLDQLDFTRLYSGR